MDKIRKKIIAGALLGFMVSTFGSYVCILILLPNNDLKETFEDLLSSGLFTKIITLGTLPNALVFHLLIKNKRDYIARGLLMSVIIIAVILALFKIM